MQPKILLNLKKESFENIMRKGENVINQPKKKKPFGNQHFLLSPQFFLLILSQTKFFFNQYTFVSLSANAFNLDKWKILLFGKELNVIVFIPK